MAEYKTRHRGGLVLAWAPSESHETPNMQELSSVFTKLHPRQGIGDVFIYRFVFVQCVLLVQRWLGVYICCSQLNSKNNNFTKSHSVTVHRY